MNKQLFLFYVCLVFFFKVRFSKENNHQLERHEFSVCKYTQWLAVYKRRVSMDTLIMKPSARRSWVARAACSTKRCGNRRREGSLGLWMQNKLFNYYFHFWRFEFQIFRSEFKKKNSFPVRETKNLTNVCWFRRPSISLSRFIKIIRKCRIVSFQVDSLNQFQVNQVIGRRVEYSVTHCLARILFVPVSVGSDQSDSANPDYFPWMFCVDADVQACRLYWLWLSREGKAAHVTQVFPLSSLRPRLRHKMSAERRALCDWIG